jgi:hypothetical protein
MLQIGDIVTYFHPKNRKAYKCRVVGTSRLDKEVLLAQVCEEDESEEFSTLWVSENVVVKENGVKVKVF